MNDDLTGIFDHITPEDFAMKSSAIHSFISTDADFNEFVDNMLNTTRFAYASSDGNMNVMAALHTETSIYYFMATDDETMGDFEDRLAREVILLNAHALFITQKTRSGIVLSFDNLPLDDKAAMEEAELLGNAHDSMFWYARSTREHRTRIGYMISLGQYLGDLVEGDGNQALPRYERIIQG